MISQVVVGLVFTWFYDADIRPVQHGASAGWDLGRSTFLGDPTYVTYGIIAAGLWPQTAYCMILYLTGLNAVDPEQVEAARLDGAKGWKMLWYVIMPQLKPATFIAFVVTIIGALRSFDLISVMTNGGPFGETRVLSFYMFEKSRSPNTASAWGMARPSPWSCSSSCSSSSRTSCTRCTRDEKGTEKR